MEYLRTLKPLFISSKHWMPRRLVQVRHCTKVTPRESRTSVDQFKSRISSGPTFQDFIKGVSVKSSAAAADGEYHDSHSYLPTNVEMGNSRKGRFASRNMYWKCRTNAKLEFCFLLSVYFETYGCQMNVNDTEIAWSILQKGGYLRTQDLNEVVGRSILTTISILCIYEEMLFTERCFVFLGWCCPAGNLFY